MSISCRPSARLTSSLDIGRYVGRDAAARREWREKLKGGASAGHFANDVIRMGLKHGDERIRELLPA